MVWRCLLTLASAYLQDSSTAPRRVTRPLRSLFRGEPGFLLSYARFRRLVQLFGIISPELRQLPRDSSDTFYNSLFTCTFSPGLDWQRPSKNIEGALYKCPECLNDLRCRPIRESFLLLRSSESCFYLLNSCRLFAQLPYLLSLHLLRQAISYNWTNRSSKFDYVIVARAVVTYSVVIRKRSTIF